MTNPLPAPDILIIGGGMVGLTLALLLARDASLRITLAEAVPLPPPDAPLSYRPSFDGRSSAISRGTLAIYHALGLREEVLAQATLIQGVHVSEKGHLGMARLSAAEEGLPYYGAVIENAWLGQVLLRAARRTPNLTLLDRCRLTDLSMDTHAATATLQRETETLTRSAPLLVAADGAGSSTRERLGIAVDTSDYGQTALVTTVTTSLPHEHIAYERFTDDGLIALLPRAGNDRGLVWAVTPQRAEELLALSDVEFSTQLQTTFGRRAGKFIRIGQRVAYPLSLQIARQQTLSRAVVLGNAAHALHPIAGQGYNLCARDCLVLADTLLAARAQGRDLGEARLLAGYEQERLRDQQQVTRFADGLVKLFGSRQPVLKLARNLGVLGFDLLPGAKQWLALEAMGVKQTAHLSGGLR